MLKATNDLALLFPGQLKVSGNVLANDSDDDGDTLSVTKVAVLVNGGEEWISVPATGSVTLQSADGELTLQADGSYTFRASHTASFGTHDTFAYIVDDGSGGAVSAQLDVAFTQLAAPVHANDLTYSSTASGSNHFIDLPNFEASYSDLIHAFGTNEQAMQNWYSANEPQEKRIETFDGLDYIASYGDLIHAFASAGSMKALQDAGANHFISSGLVEGRSTTFNGLDYIASNGDLIDAFGANNDAGAYHYIEYGQSEGRTTTFDGLDYIASYSDLIRAFGTNEQAGAAHYIDYGAHEGRTTTFDGLAYIANYTDLMSAFGTDNDAGATHYITNGLNEGRSTGFDVAGYEQAHPDLQGSYTSNDAFLTAYIDTYRTTGHFLT